MSYRVDLSSERERHSRHSELDAALSSLRLLLSLLAVSIIVVVLLLAGWRDARVRVPPPESCIAGSGCACAFDSDCTLAVLEGR